MKKSFTSLACIVLSTTFLYSQTDLGPNAPGTFANNSSVGVINWTDMSEAATSDGDYAIATAALLGTNSHYLVLTGFNFSVPDGSTINGIEVEVEQFSSKVLIVIGSLFVSDNSVRLVKGGSLVGSDYATTDQWPTVSPAYASYGGASDLWGTTWTHHEVNASDFGVAISAKFGGAVLPNAQIDNVRITITYTSPLSADLAYLYTQCSEGKVTTSWAVAAQQNNDYFTLERSDDQHTFTEVGRISGSGTSQAFATYEWTDDIRATTTTCYRLSQTDYDGKTSILGTSRGDCRTQEQLTLHPNPVDGHYFVASYPYEKHRRYELVVYDPKGITVHRSSDTAVTAITVNTSEWERGIYFVQLTEDGEPVAPERLVVH